MAERERERQARHRLAVLPASQRYKRHERRWKRYEKQRPGHQLQAGVKFTGPLGRAGKRRKYCQFTAIDDCTRRRILRACPRCDQKDRDPVHRLHDEQAPLRRRARPGR